LSHQPYNRYCRSDVHPNCLRPAITSKALDPFLSFFNATPRVALLPLLIVSSGIGIYSKIAVIFLGAFFSIAINSMAGICSVAGSGVVPTALLQRNERRFDAWRPSN